MVRPPSTVSRRWLCMLAMVAPTTTPATTPAPIASGVRFSRRGCGADGSCVVTVGAVRKAGATVGGAFCVLPGGGAAAVVAGTLLGAGAPAGAGGGGAIGTAAVGGAPDGRPARGGAPEGVVGAAPAAGGGVV